MPIHKKKGIEYTRLFVRGTKINLNATLKRHNNCENLTFGFSWLVSQMVKTRLSMMRRFAEGVENSIHVVRLVK